MENADSITFVQHKVRRSWSATRQLVNGQRFLNSFFQAARRAWIQIDQLPMQMLSGALGVRVIHHARKRSDLTGAILFLTSNEAAFITGQAIVVDGGKYRIRLNGRRRADRKLVQGGANRVLTLGDGNIEKFCADFRRKAHKNSKNKAVPRERLQHKQPAHFRGKQIERVGGIYRFRSSPNRRPDGFNQEAPMRLVFTSVNPVEHRCFGSLRGAHEKQGSAKGHIKRTSNCVHRHNQESFWQLYNFGPSAGSPVG
jgi:hypothetical protein